MPRLNVNVTDTQLATIERLQVLCDLPTKTDVIENALMILGWAAVEASNGLTIAAVDEKRRIFKEVQTPALMGARAKVSRKQERYA